MAYTLELTKGAQRQVESLETNVAERVGEGFEKLQDNPRAHGSIKLAGERSLFRIRVGAYRIIYELDDARRHVLVLKVLHRREAYR